LEEEVAALKGRLRHQERTAVEGPFLSSTPSSKVPLKLSALTERQARRGGGTMGHAGHGRRRVPPEEADRVVDVPGKTQCPDGGHTLPDGGARDRSVLDCQPVRVERIVYRLPRQKCPHGGRTVQAQPPGVLPRCQYGNSLLAHVAVQHYLFGATLG
jgi:transposase